MKKMGGWRIRAHEIETMGGFIGNISNAAVVDVAVYANSV